MSTMRPQATHQQASGSRHHPYQPAAGPSTSTTVPAPAPGRKYARKADEQRGAPAAVSPPRTQRDSRSPPAGLDAAFGGKEGGKWWDEELPAPPASLSSILDSFRRSGEGDRDLLLAILGAKKAEEERLTSLIQTRLTILQARLSVHQTTMQLDAAAAHMSTPMPHPPMSMSMMPSPHQLVAPLPERTPSLTSRGSTTSSSGPVSPGLAASYSNVYDREYDQRRESDDEKARVGIASSHARSSITGANTRPFHLPPPRGLWRRHDSPSEDGALPEVQKPYLPSMVTRKNESYHRRSISPRGEAPGIDMLLDAGRRAAE